MKVPFLKKHLDRSIHRTSLYEMGVLRRSCFASESNEFIDIAFMASPLTLHNSILTKASSHYDSIGQTLNWSSNVSIIFSYLLRLACDWNMTEVLLISQVAAITPWFSLAFLANSSVFFAISYVALTHRRATKSLVQILPKCKTILGSSSNLSTNIKWANHSKQATTKVICPLLIVCKNSIKTQPKKGNSSPS